MDPPYTADIYDVIDHVLMQGQLHIDMYTINLMYTIINCQSFNVVYVVTIVMQFSYPCPRQWPVLA